MAISIISHPLGCGNTRRNQVLLAVGIHIYCCGGCGLELSASQDSPIRLVSSEILAV